MVDSCVLLDIFTEDATWFGWSQLAVLEAGRAGRLVINPVIYAEVSVNFDTAEEFESTIPEALFELQPIPREAAFLAGKCFRDYRRAGGQKSSPLPDFFIGAHAAVAGLPLLTRDPKRFRYQFPGLKLISP